MILGFSDATISVVKRGGDAVVEQGLLCKYLGPNVTSRVYGMLSDGYEMEMLDQPWSRGREKLDIVWAKLELEVWHRTPYNWSSDWLTPLRVWARLTAPWIDDLIAEMYPFEPSDGYCLIHGDPALSNLMCRGEEILVITDPMPRMQYRREIPNRREVDWGKLLQSAMGWEQILGCPGPTMNDSPQYVLDKLRPRDQRLALLWGAIHLARVARRAPGRGRPEIATWAEDASRRLVSMC